MFLFYFFSCLFHLFVCLFFCFLTALQIFSVHTVFNSVIDFVVVCFKKKRGYHFNLLVPCFVLLYTFTLSVFLCYVGEGGVGVNWRVGEGGSELKT